MLLRVCICARALCPAGRGDDVEDYAVCRQPSSDEIKTEGRTGDTGAGEDAEELEEYGAVEPGDGEGEDAVGGG